MQAWNPFMVMLLIPFFQWVVYPLVEKDGHRFTPLRKMATGMPRGFFIHSRRHPSSSDRLRPTVNVGWQIAAPSTTITRQKSWSGSPGLSLLTRASAP
jgi:dipeptide/tripeptide permease